MKSTNHILCTLATTALTLTVAACGMTTKPIATTTPGGTEAGVEPSALASDTVTCATWQDYPASESTEQLPSMAPGFENGCVFRVGQSNNNTVHILRNDLSLEAITLADAAVDDDGGDEPFPWFEATAIDNEKFDQLIADGDVSTYYEACITVGEQAWDCNGFSPDSAYVINDDTACFQGRCLQVPQVHGVYLLSRWSWDDSIYDLPQSFDAQQTADRNKYNTIPVNTLGGTDLIGSSPADIAFNAFGRGALGEGQKPSLVMEPVQQDDLRVVYLTNEGLADDSISDYRYRLDFGSFDGDQSQLLWVGRQHYCRRSNPPGWTKDVCS